MKVLFLTNFISNNNIVRARLLKQTLDKNDRFKVLFLSPTEANRRWHVREKINFPHQILTHFTLQLAGQDLISFHFNPDIFSHLNRLNPDRVIVGGWDQPSYLAALLWAKIKNKKITIWSGSTQNESSWRRNLALPITKLMITLSDSFIAYGTRSRDYLVKLGADKNKITIIPNDVNQKYFKAQAKKMAPQKRPNQKKTRNNYQTQPHFRRSIYQPQGYS